MTNDEQKSLALTEEEKNYQLALARQKIADQFGKSSNYSKETVTKLGVKQIEALEGKESFALQQEDPAFQLLTLYEFTNATLLTSGVGEAYKTLAANMSVQLQEEYKCQTSGQKALAHLVAQNFVRMLQLQRSVNALLSADSYNDLSLKRLAIMNKAYDQANRQYLLSFQSLQSIHQPPVNVVVKTTTANIAQNQMIQENYEA